MKDFQERFRRVRDLKVEITGNLRALRDRHQKIELEIHRLERKSLQLNKVQELFRILTDKMIDQHLRSLEGIVQEGLGTVFPDLGLKFEAELQNRTGKIGIEFYFVQESPYVRAQPLEGFGGGPAAIASMLLRILTIKRLGRYPLLVMDESLVAVSDRYIDAASRFLRELSHRMGFTVLLVTHKAQWLEHADLKIEGKLSGNKTLRIHKTLPNGARQVETIASTGLKLSSLAKNDLTNVKDGG